MIFQATWRKVIAGEKSQTRRLRHDGDVHDQHGIRRSFHPKALYRWRIGQVLAVLPGRCKKGVCKIRVLAIDACNPLDISEADAKAEGFASRAEFVAAWVAMHKKNACKPAWAITFELVKEQ